MATARENFIMYYVPIGNDSMAAFDLMTDELGIIGISSGNANKDRATVESLVMSGIQLLVEYAEGVVKGTIGGTNP